MRDVWDRIAALPEEKRVLLIRQLQERRMTTEASRDQYDVAIMGGGLAGLTLAIQLKKTRPATGIVVIERQEHPVPEAAHKVGESTVEIGAHYLRDILGLEEHLQTQQLIKFGLRFFFSTDDKRDITHRVEVGHSVPLPCKLDSYQLDRGRLENMLSDELPRQGILLLDGSKVQRISLRPHRDFHRLQVLHQGREREIEARWIVDASGRSSLLKRQLGLAKKVSHVANAAWFRIGYPININEWSTDPDWLTRICEGERSLSTNHLMGPGYWVWLIPLASGSISIGIVTDASMYPFEEINRFEQALAWLRQHEPQCATEVEKHRDKIQDFRVMKDYAYSCQQVYSHERWCLTGEAGVFLDPFYSPGSDMIAISNGLVCDLITRDLNGEDIQSRTLVHDKLFLSLNSIWLAIYEQQYPLMGNPRVMTTKIIWDTAFYWGVFGLLYFHDTFLRLTDSPAVAANLSRLTILSNRVQAFFREWHMLDQPAASDTFVDMYKPLDFMVKLHTGMIAELSNAQLETQFAVNVRLFERLAGQIISTVIEAHADTFEHEAMLSQIQRWQTEPFLAELIALYRRESRANPIDGSWIMVGQRKRQEITR
jgi:flavin-dependent dehydrogenase